MSDRGWISVHRQIQNHWLWEDKPFSRGQAWIDLLLMANHENKKIIHGADLIEVFPGTIITSELKLMNRWGWSKNKVRKFLEILKNDGMIEKKTDTKKTTINVINYEKFKDIQTAEKPQKNYGRTTNGLRADTNNNYNNYNNKEKDRGYAPAPSGAEENSIKHDVVYKTLFPNETEEERMERIAMLRR